MGVHTVLAILQPEVDQDVQARRHCCPGPRPATQAVNIRRLQPFVEPEPQCGTMEILGCATEVGGAFLDCSSVVNIVSCIQDILGASNCVNCVCDVLEYLGLMTC